MDDTGLKIEIALVDTDRDPLAEDSWTERDQRTMRQWLHDSLRREECRPAHLLLTILNRAVWEQAYNKGWDDAEADKYNLSPHSNPLWTDGYTRGYSERKSQEGETVS